MLELITHLLFIVLAEYYIRARSVTGTSNESLIYSVISLFMLVINILLLYQYDGLVLTTNNESITLLSGTYYTAYKLFFIALALIRLFAIVAKVFMIKE